MRSRVLIRGGGDMGSATAHLLFRRGWAVLIGELPQSSHARRGMSFIDALFDGHALLDGVEARWVPDLAAVRSCWMEGRALPVVTLPEEELLAAVKFDVVIDATSRHATQPADLRPLAPTTIGFGPGYEPGCNCHIAIETQWGSAMGEVLRDAPAAARAGGPRLLDGIGGGRFVVAPGPGLWKTRTELGRPVVAGDVVGELGGQPVHAPIAGTMSGLARDGVQVRAGQRVAEVDPRHVPQVHGLGERPQAVARGVARALYLEGI